MIENSLKKFKVYLNTLRQKGNLAYEYNPFYNYQTDKDLYIIDGKYIVPYGLAVNTKNGELLNKKGNNWVDKRGRIITENIIDCNSLRATIWAKAGSLINLDTDLLKFDLNHPVEIEVLPSYDGSVNLILNDDKNIPRLINSRFSVREKNTYEIVDRIGENDTNIYNSNTFDKDTSLYFQYEINPLITYLGFVKGILPVGQYCFYFTYCDADDNESDFIAESGLIPVFIGDDGDPYSMDGGIKNQISNKGIKLKLNNIDKSYNYIKVYYVRYFADYLQNRVYECKRIYLKYPVNSNTLFLQITGNEEAEDLDPNILNISRVNPKSVLTLAQCKNMLFFGNIVKNTDNYRELTDLALRIVPKLKVVKNFDTLNNDYVQESGNGAYYNSLNVYNKTGYFNQEFYRFGVVFIYLNGTLSNVYNTLGGTLNESNLLSLSGSIYTESVGSPILKRNYIKVDDFGWIKEGNYTKSGNNLNGRGVCLFDYTDEYYDNTLFSVEFKVPKDVSLFLKEELGIRGLFFVRLKCVPNIIALCYIMPMDETLLAPTLLNGAEHYTECFVDNNRLITNGYESRLHKYTLDGLDKAISKKIFAGLCPDFFLNLPYYNQIFNGSKFKLQRINKSSATLLKNKRFYNELKNITYLTTNNFEKVTIVSVTEEVPTVAIKDKIFRSKIGVAEEVFRFRYAEVDKGNYDSGTTNYDKINEATNLVRGQYSPYLAIYCNSGTLLTGCLYNIFLDTSLSIKQEFQNRMDSSEPFYAISDRYNIVLSDVEYICWRGDCYINQFTHRFNRNFNDPSLPNNDEIIDKETWKDHYKAEDPEEWEKISKSDINAVKLGSWITFKVRSFMNYALRSVDHSYVSEEALMGAPRSFYPKSNLLENGENKMPDSTLYNDAYRASLGFKCYFALQDINYIKDTFSNRIYYSAIAILDSFKNNYRISLSTYFRDYSQEYGSIQKLIGFEGYLLVVFEHAIGIAVINERILAGQGDGEPIFINTNNVLPEELTIITDTYGTQWGDSVVKTEAGYVYGVDTDAKKIWRVKGQQVEIISDFKVGKFLINNISLEERELYPTIGLRNVKTHYNNNKKDVMFTFYDDVYKDEEKVWNLCFNELLGLFVTFYSWVPSYSTNIDTKYFSFDRDTAKCLSLLAKSNYSIPENTGVLVDSPIIEKDLLPKLYYVSPTKSCAINYTIINEDGTTSLKTKYTNCTQYDTGQYILDGVEFKLEKDHWGNHKLFDITDGQLSPKTNINDIKDAINQQKVMILYVTPYISVQDISGNSTETLLQTESIAITLSSIVNNPYLTETDKLNPALTTDFYLHGQAGIFNVAENTYPTYWYGKYHPFEFEFVVNDKIAQQKIFNNLIIVSNKAEPESFHFEIEGDNYEFSLDKRTMYFRQESTKELYLSLGSDIIFNRYYTDVVADKYTYEQHYRTTSEDLRILDGEESKEYNYNKIDKVYPVSSHGLIRQVKSTIFPLYYERIDTYNDIYDKYLLMHDNDGIYDFQNLSGSEISWNRDLNLFDIITHIKNSPIDLVGVLRGNSRYKEGKWNIQIPTISFMLKNESEWESGLSSNNNNNNASPLITCEAFDQASDYILLCDDCLNCNLPGEDDVPFILGETNLCDNGTLTCITAAKAPKQHTNLKLPPIIINSLYLPKDLSTDEVSDDKLPNIYVNNNYNVGAIDVDGWTLRKETKIRDKWIKIRIRYSGKNLAVIHSLMTLYNISYS